MRGERVAPAPRVIRAADTLILPCRDVTRYRPVVADGGALVGGAMQAALEAVDRAASSSETLLVAGESGTGKEVAARRFHARGPSASGPFVAINCAAIPHGLAERLLFGTKKGAYSGAASDVVGQLRAAEDGVLFLDECAELDLQVQAKLLRAIETHEVVPLGATRAVRIAFRTCFATHVPLRRAVADGRFRADLYHRIAPPEVVLPPLRDRLDEIPHHVCAEIAAAAPGAAPHVKLVEASLLRRWPGNVRELRRHVRDAAIQAAGQRADRVRFEHLAPAAGHAFEAPPSPPAEAGAEVRPYVHRAGQLTKEAIARALREHGGNVTRTARSLGLPRTQLYREMERHGLDRRDKD